jgi:hypothetical protein
MVASKVEMYWDAFGRRVRSWDGLWAGLGRRSNLVMGFWHHLGIGCIGGASRVRIQADCTLPYFTTPCCALVVGIKVVLRSLPLLLLHHTCSQSLFYSLTCLRSQYRENRSLAVPPKCCCGEPCAFNRPFLRLSSFPFCSPSLSPVPFSSLPSPTYPYLHSVECD